MVFKSGNFDYDNAKAFRKDERLYSKFWYDEVQSGLTLCWHIEYFYRRMRGGKYRIVCIDVEDDEFLWNEEFEDVKSFLSALKREDENLEFEPYKMDAELLTLFPEDLRQHPKLLAKEFNEKTAGLLKAAVKNNDKQLIKALLPGFEELRSRIHRISASKTGNKSNDQNQES